MNKNLFDLTQRKYMFDASEFPKIPTVVRKGFRARKGQVTEKPETDAYILKLRRHWISCGTVF